MIVSRRDFIWAAALLFTLLGLHLLSPILLPFVVGAAVAYFFDPVVERLNRRRMSRALGAWLVLIVFFLLAGLLLFFLFPLLESQIVELARRLPHLLRVLQDRIAAFIGTVGAELSPADIERIKDAAGGVVDDAAKIVGNLLGDLWNSGLALVNLLSLIFISPLVAFYMLRDWDRIVTKIDSWLPRQHADTIRALARECDDMISAFIRGAGTVCLILAVYYGVALTVIGLEFGLVIGIVAGLISFIPFVGAAAGFVAAVGVAVVQFGDMLPVVMTAGVFVVGQALEGNFLTPALIGGRIRLHPVWVIFAILAGGLLFGFVGVLLAVPVAAVIGVLFRYGIARYLESRLYLGVRGSDIDGEGQSL